MFQQNKAAIDINGVNDEDSLQQAIQQIDSLILTVVDSIPQNQGRRGILAGFKDRPGEGLKASLSDEFNRCIDTIEHRINNVPTADNTSQRAPGHH